jgi:hypothetical protein
MVVAFNENTVVARPESAGVEQQQMLTRERVSDTNLLLDRLTLSADASLRFKPAPKSLAWFYLLAGEAQLEALYYRDRMSEGHSALLPVGVDALLSTGTGASLLYAEIPDAEKLDAGFLHHDTELHRGRLDARGRPAVQE